MSALRQQKPSEVSSNTRKGPARQETTPILDRYRTNYEADTGYSPLYHEAVLHKPRLCGESAVARDMIDYCNMRSYGRSRPKNQKERFVWTDVLTTAELALHCRCNQREIQRQLSEMEERGMIATRKVKGGVEVSLLYAAWPKVEDHAVWKRKQKVAEIDEGEGYTEAQADEEPPEPVAKEDAVPLFKRPPDVRPGRATRAVSVAVGIREFVFVNESKTVDAICSAVIQSGRLIVSASFKTVESEKANKKQTSVFNDASSSASHSTATKATQKNESGKSPTHSPQLPSGDDISRVFDPHLSRAISLDFPSLQKACAELGDMPMSYLKPFADDRATRGGIKGPGVVWRIVKDARLNWEASGRSAVPNVPGVPAKREDPLLKRLKAETERRKR